MKTSILYHLTFNLTLVILYSFVLKKQVTALYLKLISQTKSSSKDLTNAVAMVLSYALLFVIPNSLFILVMGALLHIPYNPALTGVHLIAFFVVYFQIRNEQS